MDSVLVEVAAAIEALAGLTTALAAGAVATILAAAGTEEAGNAAEKAAGLTSIIASAQSVASAKGTTILWTGIIFALKRKCRGQDSGCRG